MSQKPRRTSSWNASRSLATLALGASLVLAVDAAQGQAWQRRGVQPQYCPPQYMPPPYMLPPGAQPRAVEPQQPMGETAPPPSESDPMQTQPAPQDAPQPDAMTSPDAVFNQGPSPATSLAQAGTGGASPAQYANMISDFFGVGFATAQIGGFVAQVPANNLAGRQKFAENVSPLPRDRAFLNYSYFRDVELIRGGFDVHRVTAGFERTFWDETMSFEVRVPFASTVGSDLTLPADPFGTAIADRDTELGDVTMVLKALLARTETTALSAGLVVSVPTADDLTIGSPVTLDEIEVENEAVHLAPFLGMVCTPNDCWFTQAVVQVDFDANGSDVRLPTGVPGVSTTAVYDDPTFLYVDVSTGYWLYRDDCFSGCINGFAPMVELHYNRTLETPDFVTNDFSSYGVDRSSVDMLNLVLGANILLGRSSSLTVGYVQPLGNEEDQVFDGEVRVLFNCLMGG